MHAWKVFGYGRTNNRKIHVRKIDVNRFTDKGVYFNGERTFEAIETNDYFDPHRWFDNSLEALYFAKDKLEKRKLWLANMEKETNASLEKCIAVINKQKE